MPRTLPFVLLQVAVCALLLGTGYWVGRRLTLLPMQQRLAAFQTGETLGFLTAAADRGEFAKAYLDPTRAAAEFDRYSWSPPSTPTPFVGHAPNPGTWGNATIGPAQCRSTRALQVPKPPGVVRVLMTGASTLYGSGAPGDDRTIPAYLEAALQQALGRPVEVFAFATAGWSTTHERIAIENRLCDLEPDAVVAFSGMNDIRWAAANRNVLWFRSYADELWFQLLNDLQTQLGQPPLLDVAFPEPARPTAALVAARLLRNVRLARCALAERKVPFLFALQPALPLAAKPLTPRESRWAREVKEAPYFQACVAAIREALQAEPRERFGFADLVPVFDKMGAADEIFLDSFHFGDRGNAVLAQALVPPLVELLR